MKSIRKCDEKVTAQQLGVKVGDKFVVLSREMCWDGLSHDSLGEVGDVLTFVFDDDTYAPKFRNKRTGEEYYEDFSCLARYEEEKELPAKLSLQNVKFDMKAIAEELGVSLENAHNIVQTALLEKGVEWVNGKTTHFAMSSEFLFVDAQNKLWWDTKDDEPAYKQVSIKPSYSFYVKKEEKSETIEFNGKQYNKEDVAKALALLSPIN